MPRRARLLDWITSLPLGWDTPVGTHGTALSGGQRQQLAADLLAATAGRSLLLITHDLDGLDQVDEIVVLDRGRVAERGTHAELARSGGVYQQLWQAGPGG